MEKNSYYKRRIFTLYQRTIEKVMDFYEGYSVYLNV